MAKNLVKVAKEFNVGSSTIVEHLLDKGFEIGNKPNAKVSDEMYDVLSARFGDSKVTKKKAENVEIGIRPSGNTSENENADTKKPAAPAAKVIEVTETTPVEEVSPKKEETPKVKETPKVEAPKEEAPKKEEKPADDSEKKAASAPKLKGPKLVGKIDLESSVRKPAKKKPTEKAKVETSKEQKPAVKAAPKKEKPAVVKETPKQTAPKVEAVEKKASTPKETPKAEPAKEVKKEVTANTTKDADAKEAPAKEGAPNTFRGKTPELRGLKILGKIKIEEKPKKKVTKPDDKKAKDNNDPNKRKRKRKRVTVGGSNVKSGGTNQQGGGQRTGTNQQGGGQRTGTNQQGGGQRGPNNRPSQGGGRGPSNRPGQGGRFPNRRFQGNSRNPDEVKEVSKKEIEDKIKSTMARINSGGKKNKSVRNRKDKRERLREKQEAREAALTPEKLQVTEFVTLSDFASLLDVSATEIITALMSYDIIASINQRLDQETIKIIAEDFETEIEFITAEDQDEETEEEVENPEDLRERAPIVTVMGHVDHGKTSLLDFIRNANVADGEAGGITQHIGAYEVEVGKDKKKITFLDTPGHEAFTAMRARGAKVTDIAIIIVAADDRIMPQTKEAISHAQAAEVPMVFAINKVDKDGAKPEKIKKELASMNILVEDWGGEIQSQDISAKTGLGIEELLEKILLVSELQELKANPDRQAVGSILEASLEKGRGYVAKTLVQKGTLKIGDPIVCGEESGKVRALFNERGKRIKSAGPSSPVLVLGLSGAPQAGERFKVMDSEQDARQIANKRAQISREQGIRATRRTTLADIGNRIKLGNFKELNLIVKGDMDGSVEALSDSLIKQSVDTVQVNIIHKAVGEIIESDVLLATASDAIIIGFQVRPSSSARKLAEQEGIEIKTYSIIYEAIEELKSAIEGLLEPTKEEHIIADLEVRETYKISKVGTVAGCFVRDGKITRNTHIRIVRNGIVVYPIKEGVTGELTSLKRFQDDAKEVKNNMECGLTIRNFNDIKVGDKIEGYEIRSIKQTLD
jgi:translation initiation factor IF-2